MRTLITGGLVITASDELAVDVLIEDEKVVALGTGQGWTADTVIDATGRYVIPGGVDGHTHMPLGRNDPSGRLHGVRDRRGSAWSG